MKSKVRGLTDSQKEAIKLLRYRTVKPVYNSPSFESLKKISTVLNLSYNQVRWTCKRKLLSKKLKFK